MKKIFLFSCLFLGLNIIDVSIVRADIVEKCKYTVEDAKSGLKRMSVVDSETKAVSPERSSSLVLLFYKNNVKPSSVPDAAALVMLDARKPNQVLFLTIAYIKIDHNVINEMRIYKRKGWPDGNELSSCFELSVEKVNLPTHAKE